MTTTRPTAAHAALFTPGSGRLLAATLLHGTGLMLGRLAQRLLPARLSAQTEPVLEFHAPEGAQAGALYLDGQLIGHIEGVTRL